MGCSNTHSEPVSRLFVAVLRLHTGPKPFAMPHLGSGRGRERAQNVFPQKGPWPAEDAQTRVWGRCGPQKGSKPPGQTLHHMYNRICPLQLGPEILVSGNPTWGGFYPPEWPKRTPRPGVRSLASLRPWLALVWAWVPRGMALGWGTGSKRTPEVWVPQWSLQFKKEA